MGLIARNVMVAMLLSWFIIPSPIYAQNQGCTIIAPDEPDMVMATRYPSNVEEVNHFLATTSWDGIENARVADDQYLSIDLERYDRTHILRFSNFGFNIPGNASIEGMRIAFEGLSSGEGEISQMQLQFYTSGPVGDDRANLPSLLGEEWVNDSLTYDRWWKYGHFHDKWGKEWTPAEINSPDFGFVIQIENQTDEYVQGIIDQVRITSYYTPPYNLCDHECVVFSTDTLAGVTNYNWTFPTIFEQIVSPVNQEILNLRVLDNIPGTYQICVTPEGHQQCCRDFEIIDCAPGSVGNRVWKDANNNDIQDPDENGIPNVRVQLYNESGFFLEDQFTNSTGNYLFDQLTTGNYKIKTSPPTDDCKLTINQFGDESNDSDYDLAYGLSNSGVFNIAPGQNRDDIDFGWSFKHGALSGCVFRDRNGDSLIEGEPGINGLTVYLYSCDGTQISSILTDANGNYRFDALLPGEYYLSTPEYAGFISANGGDSSFGVEGYTTTCVEVIPNGEPIIKLGFIPLGSLGDYVFDDENLDGLQDLTDWPISNVTVTLLDGNNNILSETKTNAEGQYLFINLPSGDYSIIVDYPSELFLPTISNAGDSELDSEGVDIGNFQVQSGLINIYDGETELHHDFGFIKRSASVTGTYYRDSNGDGLLSNDQGIPNMNVSLYNCNSSLIANRVTDTNGNFTFTAFVGYQYHIVFTPVSGMMTSSVGESDIDNIFIEGATSCFYVADETTLAINGAAIPYSRVGDTVWEDLNRDGIYDQGEPGMANVSITLFNSNNDAVANTLTNAEGKYIFEDLLPDLCYVEIGTQDQYEITESNIGTDDAIDSDAIIVNNRITSENFQIEDGIEYMDMDFGFRKSGGNIGGVLWYDGNGDSSYFNEGIVGGRMITLKTCEGDIINSVLTNNEGTFLFSQVPAGDYYLTMANQEGYVHSINEDSSITNLIEDGATNCFTITNGSNSEFLLGTIPTSTIGDFVWTDGNKNGLQDILEQGFDNISLRILDASGNIINSTTTANNGLYSFENIPAGEYSIEVDIPSGYLLTASNTGDSELDSEGTTQGSVVLSSTIAVRDGEDQVDRDFGFYLGTGDLQGTVWRDSNGDELFVSESGFEGIAVSLYSCEMVLIDSQITDAEGNYLFENINGGDYYIVSSLPTGFEFALNGDSGVTNSIIPGSTDCLNVSGDNTAVANIGIIPLSTIGDFIWFDENKNGVQDLGEAGMADIDVGLTDDQGALLEVGKSDTDGQYLFTDLRPGVYTLSVTLPGEDYTATESLNGDIEIDSEGDLINGSLVSQPIFISDGMNELHHDFGFILKQIEPETGNISGTYLRDRDGDGILSDEPGIENTSIALMSCGGGIVHSVMTDSLGNYSFPPVVVGNYYVLYPELDNYINLTFGESQINNIITGGSTDCISLLANTSVSIQGGAIPLSSIGNYVWNDENRDGIQDAEESGIQGITIELYDSNDLFIISVISDENGAYEFDDLLPGAYYTSVLIGLYNISPVDATTDDLDSDIIEIDGLVLSLVDNLYDGASVSNNDFGLYKETSSANIIIQSIDETIECDGAGNLAEIEAWLQANGGAIASDFCSEVIWTNDFITFSNDCGLTGSTTVTFTATDDCSNIATSVATFTIEDTTNPSIDIEASNLTIACDDTNQQVSIDTWLGTSGGANSNDLCDTDSILWSNDYLTGA